MNATSLYVSTCRLVIQANSEDLEDTSSWNDLYRLLPYLRNSLSCTVCDSLLVEPYSPDSTCQHHVCKACRGGKKKLKPSCSWCKSYESYVENVQLRILLQCYKKLNEYLASTLIYRKLMLIASNGGTNGLLEIIQEGAGFKDEYISSAGLSKTALKQLPCLLTPNLISQSSVNVQTQTQTATNNAAVAAVHVEKKPNPVAIQSSNGPSTTSHPPMLPHISHPIPIAPKIEQTSSSAMAISALPVVKKLKVRHPKQKPKRKGCRCGNATSAPGKLTCCGQRCPCYVEAKSCVDCRCRGCRNPHTPAGKKLRPFLNEPGDCSNASASSLVTDLNLPSYVSHGTSLYSNSPLSLEQVPSTLLVDDEKSNSSRDASGSEIVDVDV